MYEIFYEDGMFTETFEGWKKEAEINTADAQGARGRGTSWECRSSE